MTSSVVAHDLPLPIDAPAVAAAGGWRAALHVRLEDRQGVTRVAERRHTGPLVIQRAFHPESDGRAHLYVVHPPGGVVGGDSLELGIDVGARANALVTTPSAMKLYRSDGRTATVRQRLTVAAGAGLEWLPQESIVFDGSRADIETSVELHHDSRFVGWDILCLGRPAAGERFRTGAVAIRLDVRREGRPLLVEQLRLAAAGPELDASWGLQGRTSLGTLVAVGPDGLSDGLLESVRAVLPGALSVPGVFMSRATVTASGPMDPLAAATRVSGALVIRVLADQARDVHDILRRAWGIIRPALLDRPAVHPRIWAT